MEFPFNWLDLIMDGKLIHTDVFHRTSQREGQYIPVTTCNSSDLMMTSGYRKVGHGQTWVCRVLTGIHESFAVKSCFKNNLFANLMGTTCGKLLVINFFVFIGCLLKMLTYARFPRYSQIYLSVLTVLVCSNLDGLAYRPTSFGRRGKYCNAVVGVFIQTC